jgi:solute carrier family 25 (peroxisomal adenine nucleotide transporter), member 17
MATDLEDTIASEVISASLSGAVSASILYPLEVLKTKMQVGGGEDEEDGGDKKQKGMVDYAVSLYKKEGFGVYLHGIETSAFQSAMEKAFYFFAYTALKQVHQIVRVILYPQVAGKPMDGFTNLTLGCLAEWAHLPITMPIDCLTTAIQTSKKQNAAALMINILNSGDMYKGIQAYYVLCFKPALQYTIFEQVKGTVLRSRTSRSLSAAEAFFLGAFARIIATLAVFPFVRAKVVMQSRTKNMVQQQQQPQEGGQQPLEPTERPMTLTSLLGEMYQSGGIPALYQGLGPELTRGVFSAALMLMIKEKINGAVKRSLYGTPKSA